MFPQTNRMFGHVVLAAIALTAVLLAATVRAEESGPFTCLVLHDK